MTDDQRKAFLVLLDLAVELGWPREEDVLADGEPTVSGVVQTVLQDLSRGEALLAAAGVRWRVGRNGKPRMSGPREMVWWSWARVTVWSRYVQVRRARLASEALGTAP